MSCRDCGTSDGYLFSKANYVPWCFDCRSYYLIAKGKHECSFTLEEFRNWKAEYGRVCIYCGIDGSQLWDANVSTINGGRSESIGVDRVDNTRGYHLDNIVACCGPCNRVKSNVFTFEEMRKIGLTLQAIWRQRIADEAQRTLEQQAKVEQYHIDNPPPSQVEYPDPKGWPARQWLLECKRIDREFAERDRIRA
jgi:hypothetical protein